MRSGHNNYEVDHYIPQSGAPLLVNEYTNLMYSCDICNGRKLDLNPPPKAVAAGIRFFKADADVFSEHFHFPKYGLSKTDRAYDIEGKTPIGDWTRHALDLNRQILLLLRKIRDDLHSCDELTKNGIAALQNFPLDQLPSKFRKRAQDLIEEVEEAASLLHDDVYNILRKNARSPFADPDPDAKAKADERKSKMAAYMVQHPQAWRARRPVESTGKKGRL